MIIRAYHLDITIKYDRQNRVYIIPGKKHFGTGSFAGLCGDFNGLDNDDYRRLDNSKAENALQFAKSWRDSASACADPVENDACAANPDRLPWAQKG